MNKLWLITLAALFLCVDFLPLKDFTQHLITKRDNEVKSENRNSTAYCNETQVNCSRPLLNSSSVDNGTSETTRFNLSEVCQQSTTLRCNGSLVNLTLLCNSSHVELHCVNESTYASSNVSSGNASLSTSNVTLSLFNKTVNASVGLNATSFNVSTVKINGSFSQNVSTFRPTASLSIVPSVVSSTHVLYSLVATSPSSVKATLSESAEIKASSTLTAPVSSLAVTTTTTTVPTTKQSQTTHPTSTAQPTTTKFTTTQPTTTTDTTTATTFQTTQKLTSKPTEPTTLKSTNKPSTSKSSSTVGTELPTNKQTEKTTDKEKTNKETTPQEKTTKATSLDVDTEESSAATKMPNPYNSTKNIKFFYVNVLIPVGIGVCGALFIALSVLLFRRCRRNKVKKVRYFGKPKGYTKNNMDHMNLLDNSSDEE